jgi:hypothetical protein
LDPGHTAENFVGLMTYVNGIRPTKFSLTVPVYICMYIVPSMYICAMAEQGCQMVCFQTKNPNLGKFWRVLDWKKLGIFYGHLEYFMDIWDIL